MATLAELHDAIVDQLEAISGLRVRGYIPDAIEPPMAIVIYEASSFHGAMQDGMRPFEFAVVVLVGRQDARSSQLTLLEYANTTGDKSIKAAIETDKTLGLANTNAIVTDCESFQTEQIGGYSYLGLRFSIQIASR